MSWTDDRTPVSASIQMNPAAATKATYKNENGAREKIERLKVGRFNVNVIHNLDNNCVTSVLISSKKEEDVATALRSFKFFKIHIFESSKFWICTTYDAIRILETLV